eukprot:CAMPEP_0198286292 /NCGR_PEP_ID=MMETSP1449-20131203/5415_1 /TAXON_ID=420275 /ORGANISM="Attheya septentrionalis, Strain CCMP2084" /LENGTH=782 /DNA_ID=CAMNT_0043983991 /DNA_START=169 /DNA_END=2517 /DNA_ORIENTATION=-
MSAGVGLVSQMPVVFPAGASKNHNWERAYQRANAVRSRPSTLAAQEFFSPSHDLDPSCNNNNDWRTLPARLEALCQYLDPTKNDVWKDDIHLSVSLSEDPMENRRLALSAAVFASAPSNFLESFRQLFSAVLEARQVQWQEAQEGLDTNGNDDDDDDNGPTTTKSGTGMDFEEERLYQCLRRLKWLDGKLRRPLGEALQGSIQRAIQDRITGHFEDFNLYMEFVQAWTEAVVDPWLQTVVGPRAFDTQGWKQTLDFAASECFCNVRIGEIFDMVTDFPDSLPAVQELTHVLTRTRMHDKLAMELRASLSRRLIHPGANTSQIIDVYINTIKVLREIDPSDRLLDLVAEPVRSYLRGRTDTVRCIITSLTDEEAGGDLYEELRRQDARPLEHAQVDSDDEEEPPDLNWMPGPSIHRQGKAAGMISHETRSSGSGSGGTGDILSMLVGIYGSKELFVNEYRVILADKLLSNLNFDTDKEVHNLELLKLRFGELSMRQCEIMIKDIDDSKRIVNNIHSTMKSKNEITDKGKNEENKAAEPVVDAAIVSHIFWPALQREELKHHPRIQFELDQFSVEYARLKNPRRLVWLEQLGNVQLDLEVVEYDPNGTAITEIRTFSCSPLHATLISHFEDQDQWSPNDLSNETGVWVDVVKKKMSYWINHRVVRTVPSETSGGELVYELAASDDESEIGTEEEEEEGEGGHVSLGAQEEEAMQVFESYIFGMLTNMGQLPLERIHNMLKTFVTGSDHRYDKTPQQLSVFLQQMCKEEKLECGPDGMYKLVKKN